MREYAIAAMPADGIGRNHGDPPAAYKLERTIKNTDAGLDAKTIRQGTKYGRQRMLGQIPEHRFAAPSQFCHSSGMRTNHSEAAL